MEQDGELLLLEGREELTMPTATAYGLAGYLDTAAQIAARDHISQIYTLMRMFVAKAVFGLSAVEYAMYGLQHKPFARLGDYRTKKQTTALFDRINPLAERPTVEDKLRFHRLCLAADLPVPKLHAVLSRRGTKGIDDFPLFDSFAAVIELFRDCEEVRLILKPQNDALGTGVRFVRLRHGQVFDIAGEAVDVPKFAQDLYADMQRDDYLVQEFVRPHPQMAALGSGKALGTLRIVSHLQQGRTQLLYALCRIPCGNNPHDNFSGGNTGNLIANIELATGRLGSAYGRRDARYPRLLESFATNPDTGKAIQGAVVPRWAEICSSVERAAQVFPCLPVLGWDFALSENRIIIIIEANSNPDIIGVQVSSGCGARKILRSLYDQA